MDCEFLAKNLMCLHPDCDEFKRHQVCPAMCNSCTLKGNQKLMVLNPSGPCAHLGSQRKCCESLFICRKFKADCVKLLASRTSELLLCCETCESYEPSESPS